MGERDTHRRDADATELCELTKQSTNVAPFTYRDVDPDMFQKIVSQVLPPGPGPINEISPGAARRAEK